MEWGIAGWLKFLVGNKKSLRFIDQIKELIRLEANAGNLLNKQISELESEISQGNAIIVISKTLRNRVRVVGYGSLGFWPGYVEIRSIAVKTEYRRKGVGTELIKRMIALAGRKYPDLALIAIAGPMSKNIFVWQGMRAISKIYLPDQLWSICSDCRDFDKFPECHCASLVYDPWGMDEP